MNSKFKKLIIFIVFILMIVFLSSAFKQGFNKMLKFLGYNTTFLSKEEDDINENKIKYNYNANIVNTIIYPSYLTKDGTVMMPVVEACNMLPVSMFMKDDKVLSIVDKDNYLELDKTSKVNGRYFVDIKALVELLGGNLAYDSDSKYVYITLDKDDTLPSKYDSRNYGRISDIRDQGEDPTCWSVASANSMEISMSPRSSTKISSDNIINCNVYGLDKSLGGNSYIARSYFTAWKGPVSQDVDPYDGKSKEGLPVMAHLMTSENVAQNTEALKKAVYKWGAVQASLYLDMQYVNESSVHYDMINASYYYDGDDESNHAVTIIGYDDSYSRSNFNIDPGIDGAFICQNSWGNIFGDNGYFYVSYADKQIGFGSITYNEIEDIDNYNRIYQSDIGGYVGRIGYGNKECYMANVYKALDNEKLCAVAFYTLGKNTSYEIYVVPSYKGVKTLDNRIKVAKGKIKNEGFYTVPFDGIELVKGTKFAIIVKLTTPKIKEPIAVEYKSEDIDIDVDIKDGTGFISLDGENWDNTEKKHECNVCLKGYTR